MDGRPSGGFLGVDVFFVISGFLITSLLLREVDRDGRVSLTGFYRRRIKRLMPAAIIVLLVTVAASWTLLGSGQARSVSADALASVFFVSNWRFAAKGADYWDDLGTRSPLQHFWSLGVEEQFYLLWPLIVVGLCVLAARRPRRLRQAVIAIVILLSAGSIAWGALQTSFDSGFAYFSTLTRAWELAAGALLAATAGPLTRIPSSWRTPLLWAGITVLALALARTDPVTMPVPGAIVAVLATCAIIASGTGGQPQNVWPLTNRVTTYVGDISYSLYLWHLPVAIFLPVVFPVQGAIGKVAAIVISVAFASVSFHLVENPARRAAWFTRRFVSARGAVPVTSVVGLALALTLTLGISPQAGTAASAAPRSDADVRAMLQEALDADTYPALSPKLGDVATLGVPDEDRAGCSATVVSDPNSCYFPSSGADRTALVIGDSTAIVALPMIRAALGTGWNLRGLTMAACYQTDITRWYDDAAHEESCEKHQDDVLGAVAEADADAIFVSDLYAGVEHITPAADPMSTGAFMWATKTGELAEALVATGADVVFLQSPPRRSEGDTAASCATAGVIPDDCVHLVDGVYRQVTEGERVAAENAGAQYVTVEEWFCLDGRCPIFVGTIPTMRDELHITKQYASLLAPLLRARLSFLDDTEE